MSKKMTVAFTAKTDIGLKRKHNEDNYIIKPDVNSADNFFTPLQPYTLDNSAAFMAVADGMGGAAAGEVASKIVIETALNSLNNVEVFQESSIQALLENIAYGAAKRIHQHVNQNPDSKGMGSTSVFALLLQNHAYISWVGDSRAYLWSADKGLQLLTKDHSFVQQLVDEKVITEDQAFDHPDGNVILQSLDDSDRPIHPGFTSKPLKNDDIIMLCSDGLSGMLRFKLLEEIFQSHHHDIEKLSRVLIQAALDHGGSDNITLTLGKVTGITETLATTPIQQKTLPFQPARIWILVFSIAMLLTVYWWYHRHDSIHPTLTIFEHEGRFGLENIDGNILWEAKYDSIIAKGSEGFVLFFMDSIFLVNSAGEVISNDLLFDPSLDLHDSDTATIETPEATVNQNLRETERTRAVRTPQEASPTHEATDDTPTSNEDEQNQNINSIDRFQPIQQVTEDTLKNDHP